MLGESKLNKPKRSLNYVYCQTILFDDTFRLPVKGYTRN